MAVVLREIYLPALFVTVIIGYQISIYFLYQYNKYKSQNIQLNTILLAFGILFGLTLTGFLIRTINIYWIRTYNMLLFDILTRLTFIILYLALMIYLIIISRESFQEIVNIKLTKITYVCLIIPILSVIFLTIESLLFSIIAGLTLLYCYSYIFFFQLRLIKLSTGKIKKRLYFIQFGMFFCAAQHFIGGYTPSYVLLSNYSDILQLISIPIFIVGLLMILTGILNFPAFLEFGWKDHLFNFVIISKNENRIIYNFDFNKELKKNEKMHLSIIKSERSDLFFSTEIFAISDLTSIFVKSNSNEIQSVKQGNFILLFIKGDDTLNYLMYCLLVDKDLISFDYFLRQVKNKFESIYSKILKDEAILNQITREILSNFDKNMLELIE
ncbi:MAG: hypothetical protein ACFFAO_15540 [Candidatus Hermodarchaeota archaeon]